MSLNRREFLEKALGVTVASIAAPVVLPALNAFGYNPNKEQATTITIDLEDPTNAALTTVDGSKQFTFPGKGPVFVIRMSESTFSAVSAICPHQGCSGTQLTYSKTSHRITCSCHGSQFSATGSVLNGPAAKALTPFFTQFDGNTTLLVSDVAFSSVQAAEEAGVVLEQNHPNPFIGRTTIGFTLPEPAHVVLTVHSITGEDVATLFEGTLGEGRSEVSFTSGALPAGTYIYRLNTPWGTITKKLIVEG